MGKKEKERKKKFIRFTSVAKIVSKSCKQSPCCLLASTETILNLNLGTVSETKNYINVLPIYSRCKKSPGKVAKFVPVVTCGYKNNPKVKSRDFCTMENT